MIQRQSRKHLAGSMKHALSRRAMNVFDMTLKGIGPEAKSVLAVSGFGVKT